MPARGSRALSHLLRRGPGGADRAGFTGTIDQILEDIAAVESAGADGLILDLNLQDWWQSTAQMLDTALEIREAVN